MKFVYTYRQTIAFAVYFSLLAGIAAPAMARPATPAVGRATVSPAVMPLTVAQTGRTGVTANPTRKPGDGTFVPDGVTLRSTKGVKGFERTRVQVGGVNGVNVQEQVVDITNFSAPAQSDEIDPFWTADEQYIFYASNRDALNGDTSNYQLFRITSNPSPNPAAGVGNSRLSNEPGAVYRFPTVSTSNRLAFTKSVIGSSDFQLYSAAVPTGVTAGTTPANVAALTLSPTLPSLTAGKTINGKTIVRVGRPAWLTGTEIAFSADLSDGQSDILVVDAQSGLIRNLTNSLASESNVAVSPNGQVIAFDSNASGYNAAAPAVSTGFATGGVRNVFVMSSAGSDAIQLTGGTGSGVAAGISSVQPAWSRSEVTPFFATETRYFLAFASNRQPNPGGTGFVATANGSKDIYYLAALNLNTSGAPGLLIEGTGFAAPSNTFASVNTGTLLKLDSGDTQAGNSYRWDDSYPTFPPLLNALRIGFQSNRKGNTLGRSGTGAETLNVFSAPNPDPTPAGYPIAGTGPNRNDLFIASVIDLFAPTLLRYDLSSPTGEVVHVNLGNTFQPGTGASVRNRSQGLTPSTDVFFTVRAEDLESGVSQAYIQIKNPNSKYQSQAQGGGGVEHKEYAYGAFANTEVSGTAFRLVYWEPFGQPQNNVGFEYECQVLGATDGLYYSHKLVPGLVAGTGTGIGGTTLNVPVNSPTGAMYDAGGGIFSIDGRSVGDDGTAFTGTNFPAPKNSAGQNIWLPLQRIDTINAQLAQQYPGGRDGQGGVLYGATYKTSSEPSDWFVDVVLYDNAVNPFDPTGSKSNWIIYDNVWGFSTAPSFAAQPVDVLVVSDYMLGQKFLAGRLNRRGAAGQATQQQDNLPNIVYGGESYITDSDAKRFPDGQSAAPVFAVPPASPPVLRQWEGGFSTFPSGPFQSGLISTPSPASLGNGGTPSPLGVGSYIDQLLTGDSVVVDTGTDGSVRYLPSVGRYNVWRTLSRGPVPTSLLTDYLPFSTSSPPDTKLGETAARSVRNVSRLVIWSAPFAQTVFRGAGTITDLQTQSDLTNFYSNGGQFFLSGQDIAFALAGNGQANPFLNSVLGVAFARDNAGSQFQLAFNAPALPAAPAVPARAITLANRIGRDSLGPGVNSTFYQGNGGTTPRSYSPPGSEALEIQNLPDLLPIADYRGSASGIGSAKAGGPNFLGFVDTVTAQGATTIYAGAGNLFVNAPDVSAANPNGGTAVFASFGFESLTEGFYSYAPTAPAPAVLAWRGRRSGIMHNITDSLRTATVTGRILDDNNSPVTDALIRVTNPVVSGTIAQGTGLTDADGNYQVTGIAGGFVQVEAYRQGYYTQVSAGNVVHGGSRATVNLTVKRAGPGQLGGIADTSLDPQKKTRPTNRVAGGVFKSDDVTPIAGIPVLAYYPQAGATSTRYVGFVTVTSDGNQRDRSGALIPAGQYVFPQDLPIGDYQLVVNPTRVVDPATGLLVANTGQLSATINGQTVPVPAANTIYATNVYVSIANPDLRGLNAPGLTGIDLQPENPVTAQLEGTVTVANANKTADLPGDYVRIEEGKRAGVDFRLSSGEQRITGQVREENADGSAGVGIRGVTVTATAAGGTIAGQAVTDANGDFVLTYNNGTPGDTTDDRATFPENNYTVAATTANGYDLVAEPTGRSKRPSVNVSVGGDTSVVIRIAEPVSATSPGALLLEKLPPGSVSGFVSRVPGAIATEGATVRLYSADVNGNRLDADSDTANGITPAYTTLTVPVQTDASGYRFNYRITGVGTGTYVADVALRGFSPNPTVSGLFTVTSGAEVTNINFTLEAPKIYGGGVQLVSVPLDYTQTAANADSRLIFGLRSGADNNGDGQVTPLDETLFSAFNVADWSGTDYRRSPTIPLGRGKGYFVRFGGATAVTNSDGLAGTENEFIVNLQPGFNLIGHPFARTDNPFALPADIDLSTGTRYIGTDGVERTFDQAVAAGLIRGVAYGYTGENSNSQYFQSGVIKAWLGYWYQNTSGAVLQMKFLRPTEGTTRSVKTGRGTTKPVSRAEQEKIRFRSIDSKSTVEWRLQLAVRQGDLLDTDNSVGVSTGAKDGYDTRYDTEKPPMMTAAPQVYLSVDGKNAAGTRAALADDIRDGSQVGVAKRTWDFQVQPAAGKGDVTVFWPNVNRLPRGIEPFLVDDASGKRIPMRSASSYTYTPADGGRAVHRFRVEVAKPSSVPLMLTRVRQTYVGSGRGVNGQSGYRIAFQVTREADITAEVQTMSGRTISRVVTRSRGGVEGSLFWNGRSQDGGELPAGAYMLTLTARDSEGSIVQQRQPILSLR